MREFVRDEPAAARGSRRELPQAEHDVRADRKRLGVQCARRLRRVRIGMYANLAEVAAEPGLEEISTRRIEGLGGSGQDLLNVR